MVDVIDQGWVRKTIDDGIGGVEFFHPKKNSLPGAILKRTAEAICEHGQDPDVRVVVLRSAGDGPFCAGASFDELIAIDSADDAAEFFMGFARVILAVRDCPKFVITRIQGKAVGGGVGLAAASDYAMATENAAVKLSELAIGIGPFIIGPAVERKLGRSAFGALSIDTAWQSAEWAREQGLYNGVFPDTAQLDDAVLKLARRLSQSSLEAMAELKTVLWEGTEDWPELLPERAAISGRLVLSEYTRNAIDAFKRR